MKTIIRTACLLTLVVGITPTPAPAAPFCIQNQVLPPQCIYVDAQECAREAQRQNAQCTPNISQNRLSQRHGEYCVVTSSGAAVCAYADYQTCSTEAQRQRGACMQAQPNRAAREPNPYSPLNGF